MLTPAARQSLTQVRHSSGKLKELGIRLKSIRNIEKITKTMKMISSAKFAKASKTIGPARAFGEGAQAVDANTEGSTKELYLAITSDRGLCGALHTTICREVEAEMAASAAEEIALVTYGDKGRAYFASKGTENMLLEFKEAGRNDPTFEDASFMAQEIQASGFEFESGIIKFNHFASAMKQVPTNATMHSLSSLSKADLSIYDSVDDQVLSDYAEFNMTALIFALIKENFVAEQGARMVSMDGASKNAGDMIDKLNLSFNRMRQAVITTELSEIISGMVAIE
jgi:F-type H+-transporting ATPase subunit gamma